MHKEQTKEELKNAYNELYEKYVNACFQSHDRQRRIIELETKLERLSTKDEQKTGKEKAR